MSRVGRGRFPARGLSSGEREREGSVRWGSGWERESAEGESGDWGRLRDGIERGRGRGSDASEEEERAEEDMRREEAETQSTDMTGLYTLTLRPSTRGNLKASRSAMAC